MCGTTGTLGDLANTAQAAGVVGQSYAAYKKGVGTQAGYQYQSEVAANNAKVNQWQAQDALNRGQLTATQIQTKGAAIEGSQRAVIAGNNMATNGGSALNILADTEFGTARDVNTATHNADMEAWAFRNQALSGQSNAAFLQQRAAAESPTLDAIGTALTAGGQVAQSWYRTRAYASQATSGSPW